MPLLLNRVPPEASGAWERVVGACAPDRTIGSELGSVLAAGREAGIVALSLDDPGRRSLSVTTAGGVAVVRLAEAAVQLARLFWDPLGPTLAGHDLATILEATAVHGLPTPPGSRLLDTSIVEQLLTAGGPESGTSLRAAVIRHLGIASTGHGVLLRLADAQRAELQRVGLDSTMADEMAVLPVVVELRRTGIPFDPARWYAAVDEDRSTADRLAARLADLAGHGGPADWADPDHIRRTLSARHIRTDDMSDDGLAMVEHQDPALRATGTWRYLRRREVGREGQR